MFRSTAAGSDGGVQVTALGAVGGPRYGTGLTCERVYYGSGRGICLSANRSGFTSYRAVLFDEKYAVRHTVSLSGVPSRARISPDGRYAGFTVFVQGHSYASGGFSTRTEIIDVASGVSMGNLEDFAVERDGKALKAPDGNFWGLTFGADGRFFATLGTSGKAYLIRGDVHTRSATVVSDNVECPSARTARHRFQEARQQSRTLVMAAGCPRTEHDARKKSCSPKSAKRRRPARMARRRPCAVCDARCTTHRQPGDLGGTGGWRGNTPTISSRRRVSSSHRHFPPLDLSSFHVRQIERLGRAALRLRQAVATSFMMAPTVTTPSARPALPVVVSLVDPLH